MTSPFAFIRRRSLRLRIMVAYLASAVVLTLLLGFATFGSVRSLLEDQRVRASTRQTIFAMLFAREFLAARPDPEELVENLQGRERFDAMVVVEEDWFATRIGLTPDSLPDGLRALVGRERLGYQVADVDGERVLVYGSPLPQRGQDLYLFFSMEDIDRALSVMARALAIASVVAVAIVAFIAYRVASGILRPLRAVSEATHRVAEGLLETRVEDLPPDELGQLASSFNRMAQALKEMIDHERMFVAAVSHELRTPLAALQAAADVLAGHTERLPVSGREALDLVREDAAALRQLVDELLEISSLDAGRAVVRREDVRVRALAEAVLKRRGYAASVEGDDVVISTDKARLERVVANLVENAYVHGEGREVTMRIEERDGSCAIEVADRGPGIEPADLPHIFKRFYKRDVSRARDRGGVGLGLAIAKENVALLGGTIDVTTRPSGGAVFVVRVPTAVTERVS